MSTWSADMRAHAMMIDRAATRVAKEMPGSDMPTEQGSVMYAVQNMRSAAEILRFAARKLDETGR